MRRTKTPSPAMQANNAAKYFGQKLGLFVEKIASFI